MKVAASALQESLPFIHSADPAMRVGISAAGFMIVAFFSHSEASLTSYDKVRLRLPAQEGNPTARRVEQTNGQPSTPCTTRLRMEKTFSRYTAAGAGAWAPAQLRETGAPAGFALARLEIRGSARAA